RLDSELQSPRIADSQEVLLRIQVWIIGRVDKQVASIYREIDRLDELLASQQPRRQPVRQVGLPEFEERGVQDITFPSHIFALEAIILLRGNGDIVGGAIFQYTLKDVRRSGGTVGIEPGIFRCFSCNTIYLQITYGP